MKLMSWLTTLFDRREYIQSRIWFTVSAVRELNRFSPRRYPINLRRHSGNFS